MYNYIKKLEGSDNVNIDNLLEKSINQLEDEYNSKNMNNSFEYEYMALLETIIWQLARSKPTFEIDCDLVGISDEIMDEIMEDIRYIEDVFYTDFINNLPIDYFNDGIALRTYFNDHLDYLNEDGIITDYTVENFDYIITPTDPKNIA